MRKLRRCRTYASIGTSRPAQRVNRLLAVTAFAVLATTAVLPSARAEAGSATGNVLFTRTTGQDVQAIFSSHPNGQGERQLTQPGQYCCLLRVSPDHRRILVMPAGDIPPPLTGGTLRLTGTGFQRLRLTDPTLNLIPQAWSPGGHRIAFEGWDDSAPDRTGIYTASFPDGEGLTRVTTRPGLPHDMPLDYSPDGTRLVFYRSVGVDPDPVDLGGSLWVVGVDGSHPHQISGDVVRPAPWARWSPDGSRILFASERLQDHGALWTVAPTGSRLTRVFADPAGGFPIEPTWSPDGSWILFALDPTNDQYTHPPNSLMALQSGGSHRLEIVSASHDFKSQPEWYQQ